MKRIFLILGLITICNISYADIASVGYVDSVVATKQDKLPTGTSGQILTQTDNGIAWTDAPEVPEIPENIITNTATGDEAIAIGDYAKATGDGAMAIDGRAYGEYSLAINGYSDGYGAIAISGGDETAYADGYAALAVGNSASAEGEEATAIGPYAYSSGEGTVAIGSAQAYDDYAVAIGYGAEVYADNAIQLGSGTNTSAGTLQFRDFPLVNSNGKIPLERLPTGPSDGIYTLVWNGKFGTFTFRKESGVLNCPSGQYDIGFGQCINSAINGISYGYISDSRSSHGVYSYNTTTYGLTTDQTWAVAFNYGIVKGIASCNNYEVATNTEFSQSSTGAYCWCKMTEPSASRWVQENYLGDEHCATDCAKECANHGGVINSSDFRSAMFSTVGN